MSRTDDNSPRSLTPTTDVLSLMPNERSIAISSDNVLGRDQDRFPLGARGGEVPLSFVDRSGPDTRPFAMQEVMYSTPGHAFHRAAPVVLCPQRQIGLVRGVPLGEVYSRAPSMTQYDTDGQDILVVDYAEDD